MSEKYNKYLSEHIGNVRKCIIWLYDKLPDIFSGLSSDEIDDLLYGKVKHDDSKYTLEEYDAYDKWFYGSDHSNPAQMEFYYAWLHHIHNNPHHWQYWLLYEDDPDNKQGYICMKIPHRYLIEMIADWWSFSWTKGNLLEIFDWYESHENTIKMNPDSRAFIENVLIRMKKILESGE